MNRNYGNRFWMLIAMAMFAITGFASAQQPPQPELNAPTLNSVVQTGTTEILNFSITLPEQTEQADFYNINLLVGSYEPGRPNDNDRFYTFFEQSITDYVAGSTITLSIPYYTFSNGDSLELSFAASISGFREGYRDSSNYYPDSNFYPPYYSMLRSPISNIISITLQEIIPITVTFDPIATQTAMINVPYTLDVNATASVETPFTYRMYGGFEGMTIDPQTGVISGTPTEAGNYYVEVYVAFDGFDAYTIFGTSFELNVSSCAVPPVVSGTVTFENPADGTPNGWVLAVPVINDNDSTYFPVKRYSYAEIINGAYTLTLEPGAWIIGFSSKDNFIDEWYENTDSWETATVINVDCGQTFTVNGVVEKFQQPAEVYFTSYPPQTAGINLAFEYLPTVYVSDDNATLVYTLEEGPEGMTINATTGAINWTPTVAGNYFVAIKVAIAGQDSSRCKGSDYQQWMLVVRQCANPAYIWGTVSGGLDSLIRCDVKSYITLWTLDAAGNPMFVDNAFPYDGTYSFMVDAGTYFLEYGGRRSGTMFYNNATSIETATPIVVACDDTLQINLTLPTPEEPVLVNVSGSILDESGALVTGGKVIFEGSAEYGWGDDSYFRTEVEAPQGTYSVLLPNNITFIAYFQAEGRGGRTSPVVYYPGTRDPYEAVSFNVEEGSVINITIPGNTQGQTYNVQGNVVNQENTALENVIVIAYLVDNNANGDDTELYTGWAGNTNANGSFNIPYLIPGEYVLFAISPGLDYVPGYYLEGQNVILDWESATRITIGQNSTYPPIVIKLQPIIPAEGSGEITGTIYGNGTEGTILSTKGTVPVKGATIYAKRDNGQYVKINSTNANGAFSLKNLANGTYDIYAGKIGFMTLANRVTIDDQNPTAAVNMVMTKEFNSVNENANISAILSPNPASDNLNIRFNSTLGTVKLTVVNSYGVEVYNTEVTGTDNYNLDVNGFVSGMYIVRVSGNGFNYSQGFTVVR